MLTGMIKFCSLTKEEGNKGTQAYSPLLYIFFWYGITRLAHYGFSHLPAYLMKQDLNWMAIRQQKCFIVTMQKRKLFHKSHVTYTMCWYIWMKGPKIKLDIIPFPSCSFHHTRQALPVRQPLSLTTTKKLQKLFHVCR